MILVTMAHIENDVVVTKHEEQIVCASCGYDLDEQELTTDTCADCGAALNLAQHIKIYATSVPAVQGTATF